MGEKVQKSIFQAEYTSSKEDESNKTLHIIGLNFDEAVKKATAAIDTVRVAKDEIVSLVKISWLLDIDVE